MAIGGGLTATPEYSSRRNLVPADHREDHAGSLALTSPYLIPRVRSGLSKYTFGNAPSTIGLHLAPGYEKWEISVSSNRSRFANGHVSVSRRGAQRFNTDRKFRAPNTAAAIHTLARFPSAGKKLSRDISARGRITFSILRQI